MLNQLKEVAKNNCGACGDAFAVGKNVSVVCWSMTNGSFNFAVDINGKFVDGLSDNELDAILIANKAEIYAPSDRRNLQ